MEAALLEPVAVLGEGAAIKVEGAALDIHVERIGGSSLQMILGKPRFILKHFLD